jgi:hypothetical protein
MTREIAPVEQREFIGSPVELAREEDMLRWSGRHVATSPPRSLGDGRYRVVILVRRRTVPTVPSGVRAGAATFAVLVAVALAGWLLYVRTASLLRTVGQVAAGLAGVALLAAVGWFVLGQLGRCPGFHCPGCRCGGRA